MGGNSSGTQRYACGCNAFCFENGQIPFSLRKFLAISWEIKNKSSYRYRLEDIFSKKFGRPYDLPGIRAGDFFPIKCFFFSGVLVLVHEFLFPDFVCDSEKCWQLRLRCRGALREGGGKMFGCLEKG